MKAVSNSTPLIYLAKTGKIKLLKELFDKIIIPEEVYKEVVLNGKKRGELEVYLIENLIKEGFIQVEKAGEVKKIKRLHEGEQKAIKLCKNKGIDYFLVDDKEAYQFAELLNLKPRRTTFIILKLYEKGKIDFKELKEALTGLSRAGYFMSAEVYELLLKRAMETKLLKNKNKK